MQNVDRNTVHVFYFLIRSSSWSKGYSSDYAESLQSWQAHQLMSRYSLLKIKALQILFQSGFHSSVEKYLIYVTTLHDWLKKNTLKVSIGSSDCLCALSSAWVITLVLG